MHARGLSVAIVLVFLLAGCGTSGETLGTTTTTPAPATATDADHAKAEQMTIKAADLPTGWASSPADIHEQQLLKDEIQSCYGLPSADQEFPTQVYGNRFTHGNGQRVASVVLATTTAQERERLNAVSTDPKNYPCLENLENQTVKDSLDEPNASVTTNIALLTTLKLNAGDEAFRITMSVSTRTQAETIFADDLSVTDDRFGAQVDVESRDTPPSAELDQQMLDALRKHVAAADAHQ